MNRNVGGWLAPLVALVLFVLVGTQTANALRQSGVWTRPGHATAPAADPLVALDQVLGRPGAWSPSTPLRDPFQLGPPPAPVAPASPVVHHRAPPPPPPRPVLTAIVWDADPRALVHWKSRDWTIRAGGLFDEFQVLGITRDQVTLARGSETIVLQRKPQGD